MHLPYLQRHILFLVFVWFTLLQHTAISVKQTNIFLHYVTYIICTLLLWYVRVLAHKWISYFIIAIGETFISISY